MKYFANKSIKYGLLLLIAAVVFVIGYSVDQEYKAATKACNSKALDYLEERSGKRYSYPNELRDEDYDFFYRACMRARGYES